VRCLFVIPYSRQVYVEVPGRIPVLPESSVVTDVQKDVFTPCQHGYVAIILLQCRKSTWNILGGFVLLPLCCNAETQLELFRMAALFLGPHWLFAGWMRKVDVSLGGVQL
jgi:hypothetical protein